MFENDYTIIGKHATYVKFLVNDAKLFVRYIDVFMNAIVWGLLYGRIGTRDNESMDRARIYADAFANEREKCMFLYRIAMLLDRQIELDPTARIDRAFRDDAQSGEQGKLDANLKVFYGYLLGGIEVLYEKYTEGCTSQDDYINRIYDVMEEFKTETSGASYEKELAELMRG